MTKKPYHPSQDGGRKLVADYLKRGHEFRVELGAHRCVYEDDVCIVDGHGVVVPVHGGRLEELTPTERDLLTELFGAQGVAAAEHLLGLRYGTLPRWDPALDLTFPLLTPDPTGAVPQYRWQGQYSDPSLGQSLTTYGPGFASLSYANRYLKIARSRAAAEKREVGRPSYDLWRLLLITPLVRTELVREEHGVGD